MQGKTDILWFESEDEMREGGQLMVELREVMNTCKKMVILKLTKDYDDITNGQFHTVRYIIKTSIQERSRCGEQGNA